MTPASRSVLRTVQSVVILTKNSLLNWAVAEGSPMVEFAGSDFRLVRTQIPCTVQYSPLRWELWWTTRRSGIRYFLKLSHEVIVVEAGVPILIGHHVVLVHKLVISMLLLPLELFTLLLLVALLGLVFLTL